MVEWQITNIVFTIKFDTIFSIEKMALILEKKDILVDYDPNSFPALIITLKNNRKKKSEKITVFRTGVINVYGLKKINKIYEIIDELKKLFNKIGINLPDNYEIKLTNIAITGKFDYNNIDIKKIFYDFDDAKYDPEQFPAVTVPYYFSDNYKVTFNVFRDGHFICVGIKGDMNNIDQHINEIVNSFQENILKKYAKALNL